MNFMMLLPEITALLTLLALLIYEANVPSKGTSPVSKVSWSILLGGGVLSCLAILPLAGRTINSFGGMFIVDPMASFFKVFFVLVALTVALLSREFFKGRAEKPGEFLLVLWTSLIGLFFLVSANNLLLIFIALETFTLSLYILAAYLKKELLSIEAGLKYLVIGSLASAFVIYGISLIYAAAGSTSLQEIKIFFDNNRDNKILILGILFVLSGLGFKVASVPFQLWVPDVYEGAPTPVVSYLAVASKSAGFVLIARLFFTAFGAFDASRTVIFSVLAAMTMLYGNLGALVQTNIKRLFGYSSIGHAGYLLIGIAAGGEAGLTAVFYYLVAYAFSNLTAFFVIGTAEGLLKSDRIEAYRGLGKRCPWLAGSLFISLLSLAGVPPLAGFFGKFLVLLSATGQGLGWLALLGLLGVAVSLYYYLSVVKTMYFDAPVSDDKLEISGFVKLLLTVLIAGIVIAGIIQAPFYSAAASAARSLF